VCNIGVNDLAASRRFYEAMGFTARPEGGERAVFFQLDSTWLALFTKSVLAQVSGTPEEPVGEPAFCFSYFVRERDEVDAILAHAVASGGSVAIEAHDNTHGRTGYFADPDGYRWEVSYQPYWMMLAE
jgi:hypothetical protein